MERTRREFLLSLSALGMGAVLPSSLLEPFFSSPSPGIKPLVVVKGSSPYDITKKAIEAIGGIKRFVSRNDIVVIKPNMSWDRLPEQAANTNPMVVKAVVELCYQAGAKKVKVFDNSINNARRCYVRSGIAEAAREAGADVHFVDRRKFRRMKVGGQALSEWFIYTEAVEADKLINIPIAKDHSLTRLTMGMKNFIGFCGGRRSRLHQRIHQVIADLANFFKPTLVVLDATRILTANGPQGGDLSYVKRLDMVIVGEDQVAVDAYGATLFGISPGDIGYIRIARDMGLGVMDLNKVPIKRLTV
ncbi:MAG: DUF362 domain-containing protein [Acidobacteria bacterium]|nr:DUF362 domain-containing protein [Acidobacteriota bacterium]